MKKLFLLLLLSLSFTGLALHENDDIPSDGTAIWHYKPISGSDCRPYYQKSSSNTCAYAYWILPSNAYASGYSWKCYTPYKKEKYGDGDLSYRCFFKSEEEKIADAKKAEEKRIADAKKAEEKRIADAKKAEEKRIAEEILAQMPSETELQKAQNFLSNIQVFVASNPDEFDIFEIATFTMNTKLISEGVSNDEQMNTIELFKEFVKTSSAFIEFEKKQQDAKNQVELKKIDRVMNNLDRKIKHLQSFPKDNLTSASVNLIDEKIKSLRYILNNPKSLAELQNAYKELTILLSNLAAEDKRIADANKEEKKLLTRIDQHINKLKTYVTENLSSISPELMPLILEQVSILKTTKNESSSDNKSEELKVLRKVNEEISNFMLDNNIVTKAEIAEERKKAKAEEKRIADAKKAEQRKKSEEEERKANAGKFKADIYCDFRGKKQGLWSCLVQQGDAITIKKNNITKSYIASDIKNGRLFGCNWSCWGSPYRPCIIDLGKHFEVRVMRDRDPGSTKIVLEILDYNGKIFYQDETSDPWGSLAVQN
jgi:hypothetical protein